MGCTYEEIVSWRRRETGDDTYELTRQVCKIGLAKYALVPTAGLRNLGERRTVGFYVLGAYPAREMYLLRFDKAGGAKDTPGLL